MEKVKISTLSKDTVVYAEGVTSVIDVEEVLNDLEYYREKELYTTTEHHASFDAKSILDDAIENEQCNGMYEDWDDNINYYVTVEDINDLQAIFDRILGRSPSTNITYESDKLIEIDV
ncbi:hypothetical protein [Clostridium intestinale]|uniref:hypothetical protein n=1 Tax=Clostridium intestinale TaxID=36845 RepID=UPI002DD64EE8|nr:hypothetical protein [Clostridium intestinale]WRY53947.1 hypothetical protein P8F83_12210 [Clostridium intestinale]